MEIPKVFCSNILVYEPQHANMLGLLIAEWAVAETRLAKLLEVTLGSHHIITDALYEHFSSTRAKIDLIIRLNNYRESAPDYKELRDLLDRAVDLNSMRNKYVHALWTKHGNGDVNRNPQIRPQAASKKDRHNSDVMTIDQMKADILSITKWITDTQDFERRFYSNQPPTE